MKRTIEVSAPNLKIVAALDTTNRCLSREETESVRDYLADELMRVVSNARWMGVPLCRVKVK